MSNDTMTRLVTEPIAALLKSHGYRKSGRTFRRVLDDVDHLIAIQKSVASSALVIRVTVTLGVWIRSLAPVRAGVPDKGDVWSAHWQQRIGPLMPVARDQWWTVASDEEASVVGHEIALALGEYGLPVLSKLRDARALVEVWRAGKGPGLTDYQRRRFLEAYERQTV